MPPIPRTWEEAILLAEAGVAVAEIIAALTLIAAYRRFGHQFGPFGRWKFLGRKP